MHAAFSLENEEWYLRTGVVVISLGVKYIGTCT